MRTPAIPTIFALATLALAACDTAVDVESDVIYSETMGSMERVNPGDPDSPWVGEEHVSIVDARGELLCEGDVDLDAIGDKRESCEGCDVTLDVVRSTVRDLAEDCDFVVPDNVGTTLRFLAFEPSRKGVVGVGRVLQGASSTGPWTDFAGGVYDGERIAYHRTDVVQDPRAIADRTSWSPRDLPKRD